MRFFRREAKPLPVTPVYTVEASRGDKRTIIVPIRYGDTVKLECTCNVDLRSDEAFAALPEHDRRTVADALVDYYRKEQYALYGLKP